MKTISCSVSRVTVGHKPIQPARFMRHPPSSILRKLIRRMQAVGADRMRLGPGLFLFEVGGGDQAVYELRYRHKELLGGIKTESRFFDSSGRG